MKNYNNHPTLIAKFIMTVAIIFSWQAVNGLAQMNLPCTPPPAGLIAWYPGDGNALDIQGTSEGTLNDGATFTTTANGKVQEAFSFDGINDSVTFTNDTTAIGTTDFTIDFWIKKTTSRSEGVLGNRPSSCGGGKWFDIRAATTIGIELHEVFPNPYISIGSNRSINDGSFHHVAFTRQANTLSIYIDGILDKSVNIPNINIGSANLLKAGMSGCTGTDGTQFFTGALDEIEVFSRALQPHEIRAIYNSGASGKCKPCAVQPANLVAWYQGDGGAADAVGGNNGTLQNGAGFTTNANGKARESFSFVGASSTVAIADNAALKPSNISVDAWVKLNTVGAKVNVLAKSRNGTAPSYGLEVLADGRANFFVFTVNNSFSDRQSITVLTSNVWYHLTGTWDGTTARIYVNGSEESGATTSTGGSGSIDYTGASELSIGARFAGHSLSGIDGNLDEVEIFSRALDSAEIFNIYRAGSAGKCASCVAAPTGQIAFYTGNGTSGDSIGTNEGILRNGAFYTVGKVDEAFSFDGVDDFVEIADSPSLRPAQITLEAWVNPAVSNVHRTIVTKEPVEFSPQNGYGFRQRDNNTFWFVVGREGSGIVAQSTTILTPGVWYHLTGTYDGSQMKLYVNGVLEATGNGSRAIDSTYPLRIGRLNSDAFNGAPFQGRIDEVSIYNTPLSAIDVSDIYNAGRGGKCKPALTTSEISVVAANTYPAQNANFTFTATVTNHDAAATGVVLNATLPANLNFVSADAGCTYDSSLRRVTCNIGTVAAGAAPRIEAIGELPDVDAPAASVSRSITVQPTATGATQTVFTATANEADPAISNNLFAADIVVFPPTAAQAMIGGRVLTADGRGIRGALVTLIKADGSTQTAASGNFGHYRFTNVEVSQTIILRVSVKRFRFIPNTKIINLLEDIDDVNFTAQP